METITYKTSLPTKHPLGKGEVVSSILTGSTVKLGTSDKFHCNNRQETAGTYRETTLQSVENPWRGT